MRVLLVASCVIAMGECAGGRPAARRAADAAADTVRGTVSVVGSDPGAMVAIRTRDGRAFTLLGERPTLDRLAGLEVTVWGAPAGPVASLPREGFRVERFAVRLSGGMPASDGILRRSGSRWVLETQDGRRMPIAVLPSGLAAAEGARIFVVWAAPGSVSSYGVIRDPDEG